MKKLVICFLCIFMLLCTFGCEKKENTKVNNNAVKFKKEYEDLNKDNNYTKVSIKDNNYFVYITNDKLSKMLDNGTGFVFIGNKEDNESRNIVNVLNYVNASAIYYIDINNLSSDNKEVIKNKINISVLKPIVLGVLNGNIVKYQEGTGYGNKDLSEDEQSDLKLIYDSISAKTSDDACDIEKQDGC